MCNVENEFRFLQNVLEYQIEFEACNVLIVLQNWSKD